MTDYFNICIAILVPHLPQEQPRLQPGVDFHSWLRLPQVVTLLKSLEQSPKRVPELITDYTEEQDLCDQIRKISKRVKEELNCQDEAHKICDNGLDRDDL